MIVCVSLNPCIDKAASLPRFSFDAPNRIAVERLDVAGKGVNVARVVHALGGACCLAGFDYAGAPVRGALAALHIPAQLVDLDGALRVNLKLRETETGRALEISEGGAAVTPGQLARAESAALSLCQARDWAVLSGSLPPGAPPDTYARLCAALKEKGCFVAADCDGEALRRVLAAGPDVIKPNAPEFFALTGVSAGDLPAALSACRELRRRGAGMVCLSRGAEGALLAAAGEAWLCPAAPVSVRGTQGAGDSLLAGLVLARSRGLSLPDALGFASAVAGASVQRPGTLLARKEDVDALLPCLRAVRCCS